MKNIGTRSIMLQNSSCKLIHNVSGSQKAYFSSFHSKLNDKLLENDTLSWVSKACEKHHTHPY